MASNVDVFPADGSPYQVSPSWQIAWAFINNASNQTVTVKTDTGFSITVPQGAGLPWALPLPTRTLTVQSAAAGSGLIYVTESDNLAGVQSYASNVVTGTLNANILNSSLSIRNDGTSTFTVLDSLVETNTAILTGILPANIAAFTLASGGATFMQSIAKAIDGFALVLNILDGFLDVYYTASSQRFSLVRQYPFVFIAPSPAIPPIEKEFVAAIPAGATLSVVVAQNLFAATGQLKW